MRTLQTAMIGVAMLSCALMGIAQTSEPTPLSLPPSPAPAAVDTSKAQAEIAAETAANIKELEQLKAQNDEILKQQQAALDTLEQLEKDADQIRIFSKRG
jgi:TolA-binding protein